MSLTHRQHDLMLFLQRYIDDNDGVCPSFDEITEGLKLKSKSGVHRIIASLSERGFISQLKHRARAITVLKRVTDPTRPHVPAPAPTVEAYRNVLESFLRGQGDEVAARRLLARHP